MGTKMHETLFLSLVNLAKHISILIHSWRRALAFIGEWQSEGADFCLAKDKPYIEDEAGRTLYICFLKALIFLEAWYVKSSL